MGVKKEYLEKFNSDLKAGVTSLIDVARYKGEFEEGQDWDPNPPQVFTRFEGTSDVTHSGDQEIETYKIPLTLFIVARDYEEASVLDVVDSVEEFLDGYTVKPSGISPVICKVFESKLLGYLGDGVEVYQMTVILQ